VNRRRCAGDPLPLCLAAKASRFRIILWRCRATADNGITLLSLASAVGEYFRIQPNDWFGVVAFQRCLDVLLQRCRITPVSRANPTRTARAARSWVWCTAVHLRR